MKKVIILGAGVYQVPLIKTARSMGLYTIVLSRPGNYPGFEIADSYHYVDTTAKEDVLRVAMENDIDAICTSGTDVAVATIGYVNDTLHLSGISSRSALRTNDKLEMQKCFHEGGVNSADFRAVTSPQEAVAAARELSYPVVVKCVDSSGSRGINASNSDDETIAAFNDAIGYSRKDYVLVEKKLEGKELCISGYIQDGKLAFLAPHQRYITTRSSIPISVGHSFPYRAGADVISNIEKQMRLIIDSLELDDCAFNADAFESDGEISIIEIGARAGATCIPELIKMHYGIDYYEAILRGALGEKLTFAENDVRRPCSARLLMSPINGTITGIDHDTLKSLEDEEIFVSLDYGIGEEVEAMENATNRFGQILVYSDDQKKIDDIESFVYEHIHIDGSPLMRSWER